MRQFDFARLLLGLALIFLCGFPAWADKSQDQPTAIDLVEWMFQRPLTCIEIAAISGQPGEEAWTKRSQKLVSPSASERVALLRMFQSDPEPFATRACQLDKLARQEIAPGLQLQSSEAFAEWLLFMMAVIDGEANPQVLPGPHFRAAVQATLKSAWPSLPESAKTLLTGFPAYWANMRREWPKMKFTDKNGVVIAWQNHLANTLKDQDRTRLGSACLQDLQATLASDFTPEELQVARERVEFAARRLRAQDPALAAQLDQIAADARDVQARDQVNQHMDEILRKMDLPEWIPYYPGYLDDNLFWGGWGGGFPYRWY